MWWTLRGTASLSVTGCWGGGGELGRRIGELGQEHDERGTSIIPPASVNSLEFQLSQPLLLAGSSTDNRTNLRVKLR